MLDCPEHTHTSPIRTLSRLTVFLPSVILSVCGVALAAAAGMLTLHLPVASAVVVNCPEFQLAFTVILADAAAAPHTLNILLRCTTILLCSTLAIENFVDEVPVF